MSDDNFDIDIYGDDPIPEENPPPAESGQANAITDNQSHSNNQAQSNDHDEMKDATDHQPSTGSADAANGNAQQDNGTQQIASTGGSAGQPQPPKQAPIQQGTKRKQGSDDDRPTDPGASSALLINDLHWWTTEEDVRGWANQAACEDELLEITFNEHKVNGKSKGYVTISPAILLGKVLTDNFRQVFVQMQTPQATTALKHQLEAYYKDAQQGKKPNVVYQPTHINPFKTLPKDAPPREKRDNRSSSGHFGGGQSGNQGGYNRGGGFGGRGGYGPRSNQVNFQNRNFSGPAGGNMGMGGYGGGNAMPGFGGAVNNMNPINNFNHRGGMMGGMRGGMGNPRGRGGANMMGNMGAMGAMGGNMPMGGMGGMGMGMGMGGMPGNMGMMGMGMSPFLSPPYFPSRFSTDSQLGGGAAGFGAGAQPHFNPAFFGQNQGGGGDGNWNPHGAKRPRPE